MEREFNTLVEEERAWIEDYLAERSETYFLRNGLTATPGRIKAIARQYTSQIKDLDKLMAQLKVAYTRIKKTEENFYQAHAINILLEESAVDWILMRQALPGAPRLEAILDQLTRDFEHGLKLIREKTGRNRFSLSSEALENPEQYIGNLIKQDLKQIPPSERNEDT